MNLDFILNNPLIKKQLTAKLIKLFEEQKLQGLILTVKDGNLEIGQFKEGETIINNELLNFYKQQKQS